MTEPRTWIAAEAGPRFSSEESDDMFDQLLEQGFALCPRCHVLVDSRVDGETRSRRFDCPSCWRSGVHALPDSALIGRG